MRFRLINDSAAYFLFFLQHVPSMRPSEEFLYPRFISGPRGMTSVLFGES